MKALNRRLALTVALLWCGCASSQLKTHTLPDGTRLPGYVKGSPSSTAEKVIVFVHGVFGNGVDTWTNETSGAYFPQLVADDSVFTGSDVWVDDYPSPALGASYSIDELADHLRRHLKRDNVIANHRQIIFVAHSMGGLVVRAFLLKNREELPLERVAMTFFFSTPTTGSDIANLARLFSANPQLADMAKMKTGNSGVLGIWDAQWVSSRSAQAVRAYCAYETLKTRGVQVVQRESAEHLCNQPPEPIRANHINIVKPFDKNDESFVAFREAFRDITGGKRSWLRGPAWNLREQNAPLVEVASSPADPSCKTCWTSELMVEPRQRVFVKVHYENDGEVAARGAAVHLTVPRDALSDSLINAEIVGTETTTIRGAACIGSPAGPMVLLPEQGGWYPNNTTHAVDLPYNQPAITAISGSGLSLGDVQPGPSFASDVIIVFRAIPVKVMVVRDVEGWAQRLEEPIKERGGTMEISELLNIVAPDDINVASSTTEVDETSRPTGIIARLDRVKPGETVLFYVFAHNENTSALHHAHLTVVPEGTPTTALRIRVASDEDSFEIGRIPISYTTDGNSLRFLVGIRLPPDFCQTAKTVADVMNLPRDEDDSNGIDIGTIDADDAAMVLCIYQAR